MTRDDSLDVPPEEGGRMRGVAVRVIGAQVIVLLALWAFQRYFTGG